MGVERTSLPAEIHANPIAWVDGAREQVLACTDLADAQEMDAQAKAVHAYLAAKAGRLSKEAKAAEKLALLTAQKVGELLPPPQRGGRGKTAQTPCGFEGAPGRARASEARALASLTPGELEGYADERHAQGKSASMAGAVRKAKAAASSLANADSRSRTGTDRPSRGKSRERKDQPCQPSKDTDWAQVEKDARRAEALLVKATHFVAGRMNSGPKDAGRALSDIHTRLCEVHRKLEGLANRARRKS